MNRSDLECRLTSYLRIREALGIALGSESKVLNDFIAFVSSQDSIEAITSKVVCDWLDVTAKHHPSNAGCLTLVRQFLLHLSASMPETQIPEFRLFCGRRRPTPLCSLRNKRSCCYNKQQTSHRIASFLLFCIRWSAYGCGATQ